METVKMLITGTTASGKSAFIQQCSSIGLISTVRKSNDESTTSKKETSITLDFGRAVLAEDLVAHLFGVPGQRDFQFLGEIINGGALGLVVLVDSTRPETFRETNRIIDFFTSRRAVPYVVAANKQDIEGAWSPEEIRSALRLNKHVKILPCVANTPESTKAILLQLLYLMLAAQEDE